MYIYIYVYIVMICNVCMKYGYLTVITVRAAPIPSCYYRASWKKCVYIYIHYYTLTYTTTDQTLVLCLQTSAIIASYLSSCTNLT